MNVKQYAKDTAQNLFVGVPTSLLATGLCAVGTAIGVVGTAVSMATAGKIQFFNRIAERGTSTSKGLIAIPFEAVLKVLNPDYDLKGRVVKNGLATEAVTDKIFNASRILAAQPNPIVSYLGSRVGYLLGAAASIATRIADFAIGVIAGTAACVTLARFNKVNDFARNHLESTGVVADVSKGLRGFINPFQFADLRARRLPDFD